MTLLVLMLTRPFAYCFVVLDLLIYFVHSLVFEAFHILPVVVKYIESTLTRELFEKKYIYNGTLL